VEASRRDLSIRKIYIVAHDWGGPVAFAIEILHQ
jgi:pimeloyl-ACP methyl ester carboxylesterase